MIRVDHLGMTQGEFTLRDVTFHIPEGHHAVLTGKSGSGKTSILEAVCGLRPIQAGSITIAEQDVTEKRPAERRIGYVPQDGALFPNYRVGEQLAFGLVVHGYDAQTITERVEEVASLLGIDHLLDRYPDKLSGGEIQRVALGRVLTLKPHALCLDEPLSALDWDTHDEIYDLLKNTIKKQRITTFHITHNRDEAQQLADIEFMLKDGRIVEP